MFKYLSMITVFLLTFFIGSAYTAESQALSCKKIEKTVTVVHKYYIQPSEILFTENEILVVVDGQLVQVNAIFTDINGFYFKFPSGERPWYCPVPECGNLNEKTAKICLRCGWDSENDLIPNSKIE
jgi:hypothetical protein